MHDSRKWVSNGFDVAGATHPLVVSALRQGRGEDEAATRHPRLPRAPDVPAVEDQTVNQCWKVFPE